ncbi:MAG TPA: GvpL/GvpF family gas vesicle protein [Actinophytocola sp.]
MATGQRITAAIAAKRDTDNRSVLRALTDLGARVSVRAPTHHEDAVNLACLIDLARQADLASAIGRIEDEWSGRVSVRLLGPLAPYDFVAMQR